MEGNYIYTKQFIKKYWDELIDIGIPVLILENIKHWTHLVEHGDLYFVINFGLSELNHESLFKLYDIVKPYDKAFSNKLEIIITNKITFNKCKCPCCGIYDYEKEVGETYLICPVCNREDDYVQLGNPDFKGGANRYSLRQARLNFLRYGNSNIEK